MRNPIELIDELESVLGITAFPVNWPLGSGPTFRGIFDRLTHQVHLFERTKAGAYVAPVKVVGLEDPAIQEKLDELDYVRAREEIELLHGAGETFDEVRVASGAVTPVYFGSASTTSAFSYCLTGFSRIQSVLVRVLRVIALSNQTMRHSADSYSRFRRIWIRVIAIESHLCVLSLVLLRAK